MMTTHFKELLNAKIASSQTIVDILPLFQFIAMDEIQNFLFDQVANFELNTLRAAYCHTVPIMDALSDDIMQFIESFSQNPIHSAVSKKWKEYHANNNKIRLRLRNEAIENVQFHPSFPFDTVKNKTLLVDQNFIFYRSALPATCSRAFINFRCALCCCKPGDRMVVCNGRYVLHGLENIDNIQIVGMGNNVTFTTDRKLRHTQEELCAVKQNVYFENILFEITDKVGNSYEGIIKLDYGATLFMKDCQFIFTKIGITVKKDCSLYAENCEFIGGSTAISFSPYSNEVSVVKCLFKQCGHEQRYANSEESACISVENNYGGRNGILKRSCVTFKCIGSTFENNVCYPIAERHPPHEGAEAERYFVLDRNGIQIRNNSLIRNKLKKGDVMDANNIYYNDSEIRDRKDDSPMSDYSGYYS